MTRWQDELATGPDIISDRLGQTNHERKNDMEDIVYHNELPQALLEAELHKAITAGKIARVSGTPIEANPWDEDSDHYEMWQHGWSQADFELRLI